MLSTFLDRKNPNFFVLTRRNLRSVRFEIGYEALVFMKLNATVFLPGEDDARGHSQTKLSCDFILTKTLLVTADFSHLQSS